MGRRSESGAKVDRPGGLDCGLGGVEGWRGDGDDDLQRWLLFKVIDDDDDDSFAFEPSIDRESRVLPSHAMRTALCEVATGL